MKNQKIISYPLTFALLFITGFYFIFGYASVFAQDGPIAAVISKEFEPEYIIPGGVSRLTITISNPNSFALTLGSPGLTDKLPDNVIFDPTDPDPSIDCVGGLISVSGSTLSISGGTVPAKSGETDGTCNISISVTSTVPGNHINTIPAGNLDATNSEEPAVTVTNSVKAEAILNVDSASLELQKTVVNDNGGTKQAADFQASVTADGSEDPENIEWDQERLFVPGTYTLSESEVRGYAPRSWDCINYEDPDNPVSYNLGEANNEITLESGDEAICTIVNDDIPPSLVLNKIVENAFRGTEAEAFWELKADGGESGVLSGPGASGGEDVSSDERFKAGTYQLSEKRLRYIDSIPGTWSCVKNDGDSVEGDVVRIEVGDRVICSITNKLMVKIPMTGFSAKRLTAVREQPAALKYSTLGIQIEVPVLDVTTEVVEVPEEEDSWAVEWLGNRAGLLSGSALPGEGTSYVAAHNHLNNMEIGPFLFIKDLAQNDRIFVRNDNGKLLEFSVYANELFGPDDFYLVQQKADEFENSLVLITCENEAEEGGYVDRRIVFAKQVGE